MIDVIWDDEDLNTCRELFESDLPDNFYCSHYELAKRYPIDAQTWKKFLTDPFVSDYITQELRMLRQLEMQKLLKDVSNKSRSVGVSQTLSALAKLTESDTRKGGPTFIYGYIPLNAREVSAENVQILDHDPFKRST